MSARQTALSGEGDDDAVARLGLLAKGSPYPPEPPRRSRVVDLFVRFAARTNHRTEWPDYGSASEALVEIEYHADRRNFWDAFDGHFKLDDLAGQDVLDVGCGWGGKAIRYAELVGPRTIAGFDLPEVFDPEVPTSVASHKGLKQCSFTTGYAEDIPFPDERFDLAMMDDVLEHVEDPEKVISECWRVLRPGARLAVRFPSIRGVRAHHFDRALSYPGLHYLLPMRTWAAGLNQHLLDSPESSYVPFPAIKRTKWGSEVTSNLSGLDFTSFQGIVAASPFKARHLELVGLPQTKRSSAPRLVSSAYEIVRRLPFAREPLSSSIAFVGEK